MNMNRIVCFDLEMCCWNDGREPRTGEIIEIGVAEIDLFMNEVISTRQIYVKPEHDEISDFCTELTGITQHKVDKYGVSFEEALAQLVKYHGGKSKIYACWGTDDRVIKGECNRKSVPYPLNQVLNIAVLHRIYFRCKNKRYGHKKAMQMSGLEWEGQHHSGVDDAKNLARLTIKLFENFKA